MRRFNGIGVPLALAIISCAFGASAALAAPCTFEEPPATLGEMFSECEEAASCEGFRYESMTTSSSCSAVADLPGNEVQGDYHIKDNQFEIDQMGVFRLGLDFLPDPDPNRGNKHFASNGDSPTPGVDDWAEYCSGRIRFSSVIGNPSQGQGAPPLVDGIVWGYYATERPVDGNGVDLGCDRATLGTLHRPGVLYLPGFRNFATPAEAAKLAAMWSTKAYQYIDGNDIPENDGKVFVVMIAPPSHLAVDMWQSTTTRVYEDFHTLPTGVHISAGRVSTLPGSSGALADHQHRYLLDGFLGEDPVTPARNFAWAYGESAMRAVNLFDKFFEPAGWTNGSLQIGGFSVGGWVRPPLESTPSPCRCPVSNDADHARGTFGSTETALQTLAAAACREDAPRRAEPGVADRKEEEIRPNSYDTWSEAHEAIDHYVRWYNEDRIHSALDYRTPCEVEAEWIKQMAA